MTTPDQRLLAELAARVQSLEAWRAHQSDLLDQLVNGTLATPGGGNDDDLDDDDTIDDAIEIDGLIVWVHTHITAMITRPLRGELTWCPVWWKHTEAVFRFAALHRAWVELAGEPGTAASV